jgi:O-antigen/teichoic acid export membrane protein
LLPWAYRLLMGNSFDDSVPILVVLSIAVPGCVFTNLCAVLFSVQKRLIRSVLLIIVMTTVNIGLSVALLPWLGPLGSAIGTAVSYLLAQFLYLRDQHRFLNTPIRPVLSLFGWMTTFTCVHVLLCLGEPTWSGTAVRFGWTATWMVGLVLIIRRFNLVDVGVLNRTFSGGQKPIGSLASVLLVNRSTPETSSIVISQ